MAEKILKMQNVSKVYSGIKALDNVDFELNKGEILCLLGENGAGKSTLMKILSGVIQPTSGEIFLEGKKVEIKNPHIAHHLGISTVHQELVQFADMTIMENIYMGRYPKKKGFVNFKELKKMTQSLMNKLNIHFDPETYIRDLSVAQRQLVEIMKAVSFDAKIIIFDEPTSSLTLEETEILFMIISGLKKKKISMVYISHRLEDIFKIGDRIMVLRDGQNSGEGMVKDLTADRVISLMVGRDMENQFPKKCIEPITTYIDIRRELLRVKNISNKKIKNVSFVLREGEILGFGGLVGAGRTELMRAVMGLDKSTGEIYKNGRKIMNKDPTHAIKNKFALVPEDRKEQGLVLLLELYKNIEMSSLSKLSRMGFMKTKEEKKCVAEYMKRLRVKSASSDQKAGDLSGGNQQKVVIAKGLATDPEILILDEPTRGIDVGSKSEIYEIMNQLVRNGVSIIMISSELPELLNMSDRIIVMREGAITGELSIEEATEEAVMKLATKGENSQ